jgi:hypothetical protein
MPTRYRLHEPDAEPRVAFDVDFDAHLARLWDDRNATGVIEYGIEGLERKRLGALGLQLNRGRQRKEEHLERQRRDDNPVVAPFGALPGTDFHRIHERHPRQRLMDIDVDGRHLAINVNYAPILPHHFLLVPEPDANAPQVLTEQALRDADVLLNLSTDPTLVLGYNSLGAWASINHLHFQGVYYPTGRMNIMRAPRELVTECPRIERIRAFPFPALVTSGSADLAVVTARLAHFLHAQNVPYTLLLTRTEHYLIPKARGRGDLVPTGAGFFETGGEIFVGTRALYDTLTESDIHAELAAGAVDPATFEALLAYARRPF